jgi:2-polyprenyl-3-methyl-5-hydroxy-6-metoxy-1,4-benzoquinol methylase
MSIYWNRLRYVLSPQFDVYEQVAEIVSGEVLDIGSGTGFGTHLLARKASYVTGHEIDEAALKFSQRAFSNGNISFSQGDITRRNVKTTNWFDCITMIDVIEHIEDDNAAISNVTRLLKPDGKFICSTPNRLSRYRKSENHVREYSQTELKALLKRCFKRVMICDYKLRISESEYDNPIVAVCSQGVIR